MFFDQVERLCKKEVIVDFVINRSIVSNVLDDAKVSLNISEYKKSLNDNKRRVLRDRTDCTVCTTTVQKLCYSHSCTQKPNNIKTSYVTYCIYIIRIYLRTI
jgi:hypothetical protein